MYRQWPKARTWNRVLCATGTSPEEGEAVDIMTMMRATGTVTFLDNAAIKQRLFDERPFLHSIAAMSSYCTFTMARHGLDLGEQLTRG
ncbi:MAG: hypothetical protein ACXV7G_04660 [Halobacteriota archaeon]